LKRQTRLNPRIPVILVQSGWHDIFSTPLAADDNIRSLYLYTNLRMIRQGGPTRRKCRPILCHMSGACPLITSGPDSQIN